MARTYLDNLDRLLSQKCYESSVAEWNYETDINLQNRKTKLETSLEVAKFTKDVWKNITASTFRQWRNFKDPNLVRQIQKLVVLGPEALPENEYKKVTARHRLKLET